MKLLIKANQRDISLELIGESGDVERSSKWIDNNGLSKTLLKELDKVLKDSKMNVKDLTKVEFETTETGFSTSRIIETVAGTVSFCLNKSVKT
ncbi:MAG: hypothetical protein R6V40_04770 [Candidatus Moraniibacteriota bacterium]